MAKADTGIVWLASYPRSGNTWTRNFLSNLFVVTEGRGGVPNDINTLQEYTLWDIASARFEDVLGKKIKTAAREEIAAARSDVHRRIAEEADGLALVKTHNALVLDHGINTINLAVTAGAIYIVRNPLDVVISFAHHFGMDIDTAITRMGRKGVETEVNEQVAYEVYGSWSENVLSWTRKPHRALYVMRYEDMLASPEATFGGLARHLLIEASDEQILHAIKHSAFEKSKAQEQANGYRERPKASKAFFREGRAEQWRETLSEKQVRRLVADHREQMERFGYVPTGY